MLGAADRRTFETLEPLFVPFGALIVRCTPTEAEMVKYVNNISNAVKISYFNEVHAICQQLGVDSNLIGATVARSAEGMSNPLYGIRGGVPYGGACLPKDTAAFMALVRENGWEHAMLEQTIQTCMEVAASYPEVQVIPISLPGKRPALAAGVTSTCGVTMLDLPRTSLVICGCVSSRT